MCVFFFFFWFFFQFSQKKTTSVTSCLPLWVLKHWLNIFEITDIKLRPPMLVDKTNFGSVFYNHTNFYQFEETSSYWSVKRISAFLCFSLVNQRHTSGITVYIHTVTNIKNAVQAMHSCPPMLIDKTNFGSVIYNHANFYRFEETSSYWSVKQISIFLCFSLVNQLHTSGITVYNCTVTNIENTVRVVHSCNIWFF